MYCIKCGVELAYSEQKCPLCFTRVYHPDLEMPHGDPLFPNNPVIKRQTVTRQGGLFILTSLFLLGLTLPLICNLSITGSVTWGGIAAASVILAYVVLVLPFWFKRPNPVVFVPVDHAAAAAFLLYINLYTHGKWFLSFAFPTVGASCIICTAVVALCKYVAKGYLYIFGGATILSGFAMVLTEFLLNNTFGINNKLVWSIYPFAACVLIGLMLIIIAVSPALRTTLEKKFFV
ncbi:hypothetical protein SAMN02910447_02447 [Ruminococcus sp. YE71]|uniref:hypothetical protein n=1 Tax=unclassified Ruminococcus TaxID=2608920 RepID=UPI00088979E6|nr:MULTISPECIES: hypothetical protein [unclassified Ruminococcus]SDA24177.1 hypothetical protein SAMN02910446_02314 [Ruminococcus sp. YE78]SFW41495.1 hypothetical protein SAMN02910447_02447 [Ruminococcus sp. YE71]